MRKLKAYLAAALLALLFLPPVCAAADGLNIVQSFNNGDTGLAIATFTEGARTVGLLGISHLGHRISYAGGRKDWERIRALVTQAGAAPGGDSREVGNITLTPIVCLEIYLVKIIINLTKLHFL